MTKKPCIQCGNDCDILPVMLGDSFTLTYLRVCSSECMFLIAYDYLYDICYYKDFRNKLYEMQNEEDRKERDEFIDLTTKMFLEDFKKHLEVNPNMLSTPAPEGIMKMFEGGEQIPLTGGTMRFTRPSKEEKIKWAKKHVEHMKEKLRDTFRDLERLENDRG